MNQKIKISDFDIDTTLLPEEILNYQLSDRRRATLNREYGLAHDFIIALYHLRFIKKLEAVDIAPKLGMKESATARSPYISSAGIIQPTIRRIPRFQIKY